MVRVGDVHDGDGEKYKEGVEAVDMYFVVGQGVGGAGAGGGFSLEAASIH